jgi:CheY-like chemotaxis protein
MSTMILILDDDAVIRGLLCEVLRDEGFQVVAGESLAELLSVAPKHADVLITDLLVNFEPVGFEAIENIRRAIRADLPAIICTAALKQSEDWKSEIARLDAHLLLKPFTIDELLETVNQALKPAVPSPPRLPLYTLTALA